MMLSPGRVFDYLHADVALISHFGEVSLIDSLRLTLDDAE